MAAPVFRASSAGGVYVGGSQLTYTVTIPAAAVVGDMGVVVFSSIQGKGACTAPAGWTATVRYEQTTTSTMFWVFTRILQTGDTNPTFTWAAVGNLSVGWAWYSGATSIGAISAVQNNTSGTGSVCPVMATAGSASLVLAVGAHYAGSTGFAASATVAPDATIHSSTFGAATFNPAIVISDFTVSVAGTTTNAQTITWNVAGTAMKGVQVELRSASVNAPPVVTPGAGSTISLGQTATVSAIAADTDGTVVSMVGDLTTYQGASKPTLSGNAAGLPSASGGVLTQTFQPLATGSHVWTCTATDNQAATGTGTVTVLVKTADARPTAVGANPGGWTNGGGAATIAAALADVNDATYTQSTGTGTITLTIDPAYIGGHNQVLYRASGTGTLQVELLQGATSVASQTVTLGGTATSYALALNDTQNNAVTDPSTLSVRFTPSASGIRVYTTSVANSSPTPPFTVVTLPAGTWTQTLGPTVTITTGTFIAPATVGGTVLAFSTSGGATVSYFVLPHTLFVLQGTTWVGAQLNLL